MIGARSFFVFVEIDFSGVMIVFRSASPHEQFRDSGSTPAHAEARKCSEYIQRNRHRMCYPDFEAQGLCTSTGVVEAGCKVAIGTRLKRAGMHWTLQGANAIIALRCTRLSGRFEDYWERRSQTGAAG